MRHGHELDEKISSQERSPIFLQWLDCVYQLLYQFPTQFEFNQQLLVAIIDEVHSCKYGTFLFDSEKKRKEFKVRETTSSLWYLLLSLPFASLLPFPLPS